MKKRLLSLVLATSCIFGLVACKDDEKRIQRQRIMHQVRSLQMRGISG